jgi:hypothetical protein
VPISVTKASTLALRRVALVLLRKTRSWVTA